jgi:uncharacterized protein with HEPN domain
VPPSLADRIRHILEAVDCIHAALGGKSYEVFVEDPLLRAGIERFLERISEASRHIPNEERVKAPEIAWQKMADFGNRLRHAYHGVDAKIVWDIVHHDLAPLRAFVENLVKSESR